MIAGIVNVRVEMPWKEGEGPLPGDRIVESGVVDGRVWFTMERAVMVQTVQERYSALRREYFNRTGRMPTRLLWSKDVQDTAIEEERARIIELEARCGGGFTLAESIPMKARSRWMEFVMDSALPAGTMVFDEGAAE